MHIEELAERKSRNSKKRSGLEARGVFAPLSVTPNHVQSTSLTKKSNGGEVNMEKIKRSVVEALKKKFGMEDVPDGEFVEWWRRNHGTGYALQIVEDRK